MRPFKRVLSTARQVREVLARALAIGATTGIVAALIGPGVAGARVHTSVPGPSSSATQNAAADFCGAVLLSGSGWLGGNGVNVKSNYPNQGISNGGVSCGGDNYVDGVLSGNEWECVELVNRLYLTKGWITSTWYGNGGGSDSMYYKAPGNLDKQPQGSISYVAPGDAVMFNVSGSSAGHVAIVNSVSGSSVEYVNQNFGTDSSPQVYTSGTLSGGSLSVDVSGMSVIGVVHAPSGSAASGYETAFQANTSDLWSAGSAGVEDWDAGMAPGTSPRITASGSGYEQALQVNTSDLWTLGSAGDRDWGLGMMAGTSPSITASASGYEVALQVNTSDLWTLGSGGDEDWGLGMMAGTSPGIA